MVAASRKKWGALLSAGCLHFALPTSFVAPPLSHTTAAAMSVKVRVMSATGPETFELECGTVAECREHIRHELERTQGRSPIADVSANAAASAQEQSGLLSFYRALPAAEEGGIATEDEEPLAEDADLAAVAGVSALGSSATAHPLVLVAVQQRGVSGRLRFDNGLAATVRLLPNFGTGAIAAHVKLRTSDLARTLGRGPSDASVERNVHDVMRGFCRNALEMRDALKANNRRNEQRPLDRDDHDWAAPGDRFLYTAIPWNEDFLQWTQTDARDWLKSSVSKYFGPWAKQWTAFGWEADLYSDAAPAPAPEAAERSTSRHEFAHTFEWGPTLHVAATADHAQGTVAAEVSVVVEDVEPVWRGFHRGASGWLHHMAMGNLSALLEQSMNKVSHLLQTLQLEARAARRRVVSEVSSRATSSSASDDADVVPVLDEEPLLAALSARTHAVARGAEKIRSDMATVQQELELLIGGVTEAQNTYGRYVFTDVKLTSGEPRRLVTLHTPDGNQYALHGNTVAELRSALEGEIGAAEAGLFEFFAPGEEAALQNDFDLRSLAAASEGGGNGSGCAAGVVPPAADGPGVVTLFGLKATGPSGSVVLDNGASATAKFVPNYGSGTIAVSLLVETEDLVNALARAPSVGSWQTQWAGPVTQLVKDVIAMRDTVKERVGLDLVSEEEERTEMERDRRGPGIERERHNLRGSRRVRTTWEYLAEATYADASRFLALARPNLGFDWAEVNRLWEAWGADVGRGHYVGAHRVVHNAKKHPSPNAGREEFVAQHRFQWGLVATLTARPNWETGALGAELRVEVPDLAALVRHLNRGSCHPIAENSLETLRSLMDRLARAAMNAQPAHRAGVKLGADIALLRAEAVSVWSPNSWRQAGFDGGVEASGVHEALLSAEEEEEEEEDSLHEALAGFETAEEDSQSVEEERTF